MRFLAGFILLLGVNACHEVVGPDDQFREAHKKWVATGSKSYVLRIGRACGECVRETLGPVDITVRDGFVVSRTYVGSGEAVPKDFAPLFPTVPELFLMVATLQGDKPYKFDVQYDQASGIPIVISVDYYKDMVDDEIGIYVTEFHPQ